MDRLTGSSIRSQLQQCTSLRFGSPGCSILQQGPGKQLTDITDPQDPDVGGSGVQRDVAPEAYEYRFYFIPWEKSVPVQLFINRHTLLRLFEKHGVSPRICYALKPNQNPAGVNVEIRANESDSISAHLWYALEFSGEKNVSGFAGFTTLVYHILCDGPARNTIFYFSTRSSIEDIKRQLRNGMVNYEGGLLEDRFTPHVLLLRNYLNTWDAFSSFMTTAHTLNVHTSLRTAPDAVDSACISELGKTLNDGRLYPHDLKKVCSIIEQLKGLHGRIEDIWGGVQPEDERPWWFTAVTFEFENLMVGYKSLLETWRFQMEIFLNARKSLATSVVSNNQAYIRSNSIALRRMAANSRREALRVQSMATLARRETRQMATIAFLTMAYLPGSFVATLFGMDIFGLEDGKRFKAPEKVWIFFSIAIPLTAATFLIWYAWDQRKTRLEALDSTVGGDGNEPGDLEEEDTLVVEVPLAKPEPTIEQLLLGMFEKIGNGGSGGGVGNGSNGPGAVDDEEDSGSEEDVDSD